MASSVWLHLCYWTNCVVRVKMTNISSYRPWYSKFSVGYYMSSSNFINQSAPQLINIFVLLMHADAVCHQLYQQFCPLYQNYNLLILLISVFWIVIWVGSYLWRRWCDSRHWMSLCPVAWLDWVTGRRWKRGGGGAAGWWEQLLPHVRALDGSR